MPIQTKLLVSIVAAAAISQSVSAQEPAEPTFDVALAAQDLESALLAVSRLSGREIIFSSELVARKRAVQVSGRLTAMEAIRRLLRGTGLDARLQSGAIVVARAGSSGQEEGDIVVTGSRIRGAQVYAPVTSVSREVLRAQGQTELGEALRTIPQNFGGGQSPYIGLGAEDFGSDNLNSGSNINLRGLGPDATLTLLNGRRLAYGGVFEGVDVSAIPLAAIDRVEVVADGASAIYGSDAVAGVVNVILRRDFSGLETSARLGGSPRGGNVQHQLQAVAGTTWLGGGVVGTLSYDRNSAITADQRPFSRQLDQTTTIVPSIRQLGAVVSAHQALGSTLEGTMDFLYSRRRSFITYPNAPTGSYRDSGVDRHLDTEAFAVAPSLKLAIGGSWSATVNGSYASDALAGRGRYFLSGDVISDTRTTYVNRSAGAEVNAEGLLAALPGGEARLALGGGYRWVGLQSRRSGGSSAALTFRGARDSYYGFGELNVPLVGTGNRQAGVERLSVNAAGRYEHYPRLGDVFTPKLGLLYAPTRFLEVRGTWGRSFKAPTLYQLFEAPGALLFTADTFGGVGFPETATAVYAYGGNAGLKPQRATSWSAGLVLTPFADRRLTLEASYFKTRYTDRIVSPITSAGTALSNPLIADLVQLDPSISAIDTIVADARLGLVNYSGYPYDPTQVVAIIDNRNRNVAAQRVEGLDASAAWRMPVSPDATLALSASATYLTSARQLSAGQPETLLAGHVFNPPHFRGRGGASLSHGALTASAFVTIVGSVEDDRFAPPERIGGQSSVDLSIGYGFPDVTGPLRAMSLQLAILNAFDDLPERIRTSEITYTPFDATNYNPVGRLVSVTLRKKW